MQNNNIGYVIIETASTPNDVEPANIIKENKNGMVIAQGTLQRANEKNRNGRWYDSRDLFPQLTCERSIELINTGNMRAENGHPLSKDLTRQQTIDPSKTCAIFNKFWTEGDLVKATFRGTNNEYGKEFNQDLLDGFSPSWSLRALGTIKSTNRGTEVKGIKLITYDRVIYPSHKGAYTDGIVEESSNLISEGSSLLLENNDPGMLIPITNQSVLDYIKEESLSYKKINESFDLLYDDIKLVNGNTQVQLSDKAGGIFVINLEQYIHDEIMNECLSKL